MTVFMIYKKFLNIFDQTLLIIINKWRHLFRMLKRVKPLNKTHLITRLFVFWPPAPGEIIITQEPDYRTGPAPPLIIRQAAARAETPEPLVVREAPPQPPAPVGPKRITISGKRLPPPPRKVVIERLAPLPAKPQNVIIERWLPYAESKRRVIFNKAAEVKAEVALPRNVIVQWESPRVNVRKEVKYLGVIRANPAEYVQRYVGLLWA